MVISAAMFRPKRKAVRPPAAPKRPAGPPPLPAAPAPVREYVAQTAARLGWSRLGGLYGGGRDLTNETWEMRRDYPEMSADESVSAATESLISDIGSQNAQVLPNPGDDPKRAKVVKDFVYEATVRLGAGDLASAHPGGVFGLVDAIARHGFMEKHSLCQILPNGYREAQGRWVGKEFMRCVKPKGPQSYDLDVDEFMNVRGVVNRGPDGKAGPATLPMMGWIYFANRALYGRPEGQSLYRSAHRYWLSKHRAFQLWGECSEKLTGHFLVGTGATPQNSERFAQILEAARGCGYIVLEEPGWKVVLENLEQGAGAVIERFIRYCDEAIFRAIRGAHLQQLQGKENTKQGSSQVAADQSDKITWQHLYRVSEVITRYFNTFVVRHNFAAGTPVPTTVLGDLDPGETLAKLRIAAVMRNDLGMKLSNAELYRESPFGPPSDDPADVNEAPAAPPAAPAKPPGTDPALAGLYSESANAFHTFCGGPGSGRPGPCPEPTTDHSRHRPDLPRHAGTGRELPTAPPAVSLDDAVAALEARFGKGAVKLVDPNASAAPKPAAPAPAAPAPAAPRPRHVQLAEREAAARKQLADLEGSHDQEASFDRAAARHELALIDAERRGLAAPRFGHHYAESAEPVAPAAPPPLNVTVTAPDPELPATLRELADALRNQPATQVTVTPHVTVETPERPRMKVLHVRDAAGNLVESWQVPVGQNDDAATPGESDDA